MKNPICFRTVLAVFLLPAAFLFAAVIDDIRIENLDETPLDESFVRAYTSLRAGQEIENEAELNAAVARDVDNLRRSGRFSFVRAYLEQDDGNMTLVYSVAPRLRLREIEVNGAEKIGNRKLKRELGLELGDYVDEALVGEKVRELEGYCRENKFPEASIEWTLEADEETGAADLSLAVDEGQKMRVKEISFENERFERQSGVGRFFKRLVPNIFPSRSKKLSIHPNDLRDVMQQKTTWWITPWFGAYRPELVEADRAALRAYYENRGFLDVQIEKPDVERLGGGKLELVYPIEEGPRYRLKSVGIEGEELFNADELMKQVRLQPGDVASRSEINDAASSVSRYYGNRGYIRNYVNPVISTDPETKTADVIFDVSEGQPATIQEIKIRGNEKTRDEVIRRELAVYPGEKFHQQKVETSERRLKNLGYFETVDSSYEPAGQTNAYDLTYTVKEKAMGSFLVGAGFSSVDSLVGFAELSHGNFDIKRWPPIGDGQKMKVRVQAGTSRNDLEVSFVEPWFMDRKLSLGVDLYHRNAGYYSDEYDLQTIGGRLSLTKPLGAFTRGTVSYSLEQFTVSDVDSTAAVELQQEEGSRIKSAVGVSVSRDTRDQFFVPTRGNYTSVGSEVAGGPLGGETDIYMLEAKTSQFWPVLGDHVFNLKGAVSTVDSYGSSSRVPIFDRLFLGGPRTIRAFAYRDVSPRSVSDPDEPIGGQSSWYATAEYTIPLWRKIRAAAFYDIGAVSADEFDFFESSNINSGYGIGARFDLPMFPLRLDYAFPHITDDANEGAGPRWSFLLGYTF